MRVEAFAPVMAVLDGLVHPTARRRSLDHDRQRSFIAAHLGGGLLGLLAIPVYLALWGAPGGRDAAALAWLVAPMLSAVVLSRTGRFEVAHLLSALTFTGLVAHVAWHTGGLASFVAGWLIVAPVEAALSGSRRVVVGALAGAAATALGLHAAATLGWLPAAHPLALGQAALLVGAASAVAYAGALALSWDASYRRGEAVAREEEARYRLLAENATDMISRHTRSGLVLLASPAANGLLGATPDDIAGDGLFQRVHVADRPAYLQAFAEAARIGGAVTVEFRARAETADGPEWRWLEMRCRPADQATPVEIVAVTRDVEARKRHEAALVLAADRVEQASAAKTRFLANMSHELRTPLNAIIGFSELMAHDSFDCRRERVIEYAQLVNDSGRHLLDVVNGILDMSKIEAGSFDIVPEPFDARSLLTNVVALMQPAADKAGIALVIDLPADAPELAADRRACKQILLNLLSNAIKFTERGGRVTTTLAFDQTHARLAVADTGIGISEEDLPRLANPFVQAQGTYDKRYEGTGLGLSVVKGLAELHGGELVIASQIGQGTVVTVRLPVDPEARAKDVVTPFPQRRDGAVPETERMLRHG